MITRHRPLVVVAAAVLAIGGLAWWGGPTSAENDAPRSSLVSHDAPDDAAWHGESRAGHERERDAVAVERSTVIFPVARHDLGHVIGQFGDPRDGGNRSHRGLDIAAPIGTPVLAPAAGVVDRIEIGGLGGRAVWLREVAEDRSYYFAHLDAIAVQRGQRVPAGGLIGTVGRTGNAARTPPHLHFGVYEGRRVLDPAAFLESAAPRTGARAYVAEEQPAGPLMRTRMDGAALRSAPGGGTTIAVLPRQETVTVLSTSGRNVYVRYRHHEGYMAAWLLEEV